MIRTTAQLFRSAQVRGDSVYRPRRHGAHHA